MPAFFAALAAFFTPVIIFFVSVGVIVSLLLGCIADPSGAVNQFICTIINAISSVFPSTPDNLRLGKLIDAVASIAPAFGTALIRDIATTIGSVFTVSLAIRIYKLIPFKAT